MDIHEYQAKEILSECGVGIAAQRGRGHSSQRGPPVLRDGVGL